MTHHRSQKYLEKLLLELIANGESEHIEFKRNNTNPQLFGVYISALSNSAAFVGNDYGYLVWGVDDDTHDVVGTTFDPTNAKIGNNNLEPWLLSKLSPRLDFRFHKLTFDSKNIVILEIDSAFDRPTTFNGEAYIRVGSNNKKLSQTGRREAELWRLLDRTSFVEKTAKSELSPEEVLSLIDYEGYCSMLEQSMYEKTEDIMECLRQDRLIKKEDDGTWSITNLGALLFAKNMNHFTTIFRKAPRVVIYQGNDRTNTISETIGQRGYALAFKGLVEFTLSKVPSNEVLERVIRTNTSMYPPIAIRELTANALIHQSLETTGSSPVIEIFHNRIEFTNPGEPLIERERLLDSPPRSRNETMASLMRRMGICEERGSGIDKVVDAVEMFRLPAPEFETPPGFTRVTVFAHKEFVDMTKEERLRACYLHSCLKAVRREYLTNKSLRDRFGLSSSSNSQVSRLIKDAVEEEYIKPYDPNTSNRWMKYVPFWAPSLGD
tara:strand:- start:857 stop:2335 length:1479 start_codon:yes stop_codon:yes gene_type:complete